MIELRGRLSCAVVLIGLSSSAIAAPDLTTMEPITVPIAVAPEAGWQAYCDVDYNGHAGEMYSVLTQGDGATVRQAITLEFEGYTLSMSWLIGADGKISGVAADATRVGGSPYQIRELEDQAEDIADVISSMSLSLYGRAFATGDPLFTDTELATAFSGLDPRITIDIVQNDYRVAGRVRGSTGDFMLVEGTYKIILSIQQNEIRLDHHGRGLIHIDSGMFWELSGEDITLVEGRRETARRTSRCEFIPPADWTPNSAPSIASRLRELQDLLEQGLVTPEEAANKRREILGDL